MFTIDNDVILDGEGQLETDRFEVPEGVTAELRAFRIRGLRLFADGTAVINQGDLRVTDTSIAGFTGSGMFNSGTLALVNGSVSGNWGGIENTGTLTVADSTVSRNRTGDFGGGGTGIYNTGTLTVTNSTITENVALGGGIGPGVVGSAGIYNSGTATIVASTVSRNDDQSGLGGGGIHNDGGSVTLINSTVSGNDASGPGGGIFNSGTLSVVHTTLSENTQQAGAAIHNDGSATLRGSLLDGGCSGSGAPSSNGYNVESPANTCGLDPDDTDLVEVPAPMLGPLQDNGGPTETHALLPESVAMDRIPEADCDVDIDQRGEPRPAAGPELECDVGAFEVQP